MQGFALFFSMRNNTLENDAQRMPSVAIDIRRDPSRTTTTTEPQTTNNPSSPDGGDIPSLLGSPGSQNAPSDPPHTPSNNQGPRTTPETTTSRDELGTTTNPPYPSRMHERAAHVPPLRFRVSNDDDEDITSPPPPYWTIDRSNDILSTPITSPSHTNGEYTFDTPPITPPPSSSTVDIDVTTTLPLPPPYVEISVTTTISNVSQSDTTLTTTAPPSYRTLYQIPEEEDVNANESQQNTEEPLLANRKERRILQFYSLVVGVVIPASMVILKQRCRCPAKPSILNSLIPGIVFHVLHGLTTILTQGKSLKLDKMDIFIVIIFFWNISVSVMVYSIDSNDDCDPMLYYFMFCLATIYNVLYGLILAYIFRPLFIRMHGKLKAFCTSICPCGTT